MYSHANVQYHKPHLVPSHHYSTCFSTFVRIVALNIQTNTHKHKQKSIYLVFALKATHKKQMKKFRNIRNICRLIPSHWNVNVDHPCMYTKRERISSIYGIVVCMWTKLRVFQFYSDKDQNVLCKALAVFAYLLACVFFLIYSRCELKTAVV